MKKALKIFGIIFGVIIILLIAAPFLFKGSLEKMLKKTINENLNATVNWEKLDLSLLKSFPDASLQLKNFSVINKIPFEGDTLVSGKNLALELGIMQLFKSKDLKVDRINLEEAFINIKVDSLGHANYNIMLEETEEPSKPASDSSENFKFELQQYEIKNSRISYSDETLKTHFILRDFQHKGKGDLSEEISKLDTYTETRASFKMDGTEYLSNHKIALDAVFEIDLKNQKYSFLDNEAKINELPLVFTGFVQLHDENTEVDLSFKTPSSDFKNFLALIPEEYVKQISDVQTTGDFIVDGKLAGFVDDDHIPTMDIKIQSNNASFKYPDLPKKVDQITLDLLVKNETGFMKDTYVNFPNITFRIDNEPFRMSGSARNFTENPLINLAVQGSVNLANLNQIMPLEIDQDLNGIFKADITANFDMNSVEKEQYQNIRFNGNASLTGFSYDAGFKDRFEISKAEITGKPEIISLNSMNAKIGKTDLQANGNIENLISFLMGKQNLKGRFAVNSNTFNISDFMVNETGAKEGKNEKTASSETSFSKDETIKIPDFLDATLDFTIRNVIYDNIELKNAKGTAAIQDETISIRNFTSDIFGGNIALSGNVSTKTQVPTFAMNLNLNDIDIDQSFEKLELLQFLAPIAKALQGHLNTNFDLKGNLTQDFTPDLRTLGGSVMAKILTAEVNPEQTPLLASLGEKVPFLNLNQLSLQNLTTHLTFDNGNIAVKPFQFKHKDIVVDVAGSHGLDKSMNYQLKLDIPAKYLGSDVTKLLKDLKQEEAEKMHINLPVGITGTFTKPQVSVNTKTAVEELTQEIIAKQKDNLIDKGKGYLDDLINKNKKKDTSTTKNSSVPADSTAVEKTEEKNKNEETKEKVKGLLDGILKGKKKDGGE